MSGDFDAEYAEVAEEAEEAGRLVNGWRGMLATSLTKEE
jgi:hypothetical protein